MWVIGALLGRHLQSRFSRVSSLEKSTYHPHYHLGRVLRLLIHSFSWKGTRILGLPSHHHTSLSSNYDNSAWVAYDRQFHREALASKDLNWSVPNHRLYNEAFTGRVRSIPRCTICLSAHHLRPVNPICLQLLLGTSSRLHGLVGLYPLMLLVPLGGGLLCAGITMTIAVRILGAVICISVSIARSFTLIVIAPRTLQIIPLKFLGLTGCSSH